MLGKAKEKHGQCVYFRPEDDNKQQGQCMCPVPPHFTQEYNTIFRTNPIDSHYPGFSCPCFKSKKKR